MKKVTEIACALIVVGVACWVFHTVLGVWIWLVGGIGFLAAANLHGDVFDLIERVFAPIREKRQRKKEIRQRLQTAVQQAKLAINMKRLLNEQIDLMCKFLNGDKTVETKMRENERIFEQETGFSLHISFIDGDKPE